MNRVYLIGQTRTPKTVEVFFIHHIKKERPTWSNRIHSIDESLARSKKWTDENTDVNFKLEITYDD